MRAEALFTEFIVEHHLPLACADHTWQLFRKMSPDSNIATKCGYVAYNARTVCMCP